MSPRRRWVQWPARIALELEGIAGIVGLGGIGIGAGSYAFLGTPALALAGLGAAVVMGAVSYAVYKAMPIRTNRPQDLVGQIVNIADLEKVSPAIRTLSIIGNAQAGKTTLRNRLSFDFSSVVRTQQISAYVASLQTSPPTYLAILDGGGERYAQQFELAKLCDFLCIVIDHNESDGDSAVDMHRLAEHEAFLKQVGHALDETNAGPKLWTQFLINKHDLWISASPKQRKAFDRFCKNEVEKWRQERRAKRVESRPYSNDEPNDVAQFMDQLKRLAAEQDTSVKSAKA